MLTYRLTADFPRDETFGLRHSLRKAAVDVPGYIAEACGKADRSESSRTMSAAIGTANRLEYYALVARDLGLLSVENYNSLFENVVEVRKMLSGLNQRMA